VWKFTLLSIFANGIYSLSLGSHVSFARVQVGIYIFTQKSEYTKQINNSGNFPYKYIMRDIYLYGFLTGWKRWAH